MKITKAVIPVAGLGTRLLPASKNIPKEMLHIVDKPSILYVVEEALEAGITTIIFVQGRHKNSIEDLFDVSFELEYNLQKQNKNTLLKTVQNIYNKTNIISVRQKKPLGLGHAIYCARSVVGMDPFAVLLPDEIMVGSPNTTKELILTFEKFKQNTVSILDVKPSEVSKYGVAHVTPIESTIYKVEKVVEKPKTSDSTWILPGRYVFNNEIMDIIKNPNFNDSGEMGLSCAINILAKQEKLIAKQCKNRRFDTGNKLGLLKANIELGLEHPEIADEFKQYLTAFVKTL